MRFGHVLIAGSLVLAGAVGSAWSQAPKPGVTVTPQTMSPPIVSDLRVRPTGDVRVSTPVTSVALDADECEALGGKVVDDIYSICKSKKVCLRVDNFGKAHGVCLSAEAE